MRQPVEISLGKKLLRTYVPIPGLRSQTVMDELKDAHSTSPLLLTMKSLLHQWKMTLEFLGYTVVELTKSNIDHVLERRKEFTIYMLTYPQRGLLVGKDLSMFDLLVLDEVHTLDYLRHPIMVPLCMEPSIKHVVSFNPFTIEKNRTLKQYTIPQLEVATDGNRF